MGLRAKSVFTQTTHSLTAGREAAETILAESSFVPKIVAAYLTDSHDQQAFLHGLTETLGSDIPVVGCSGQGVTGRGIVVEDGYAASVMGLGGDSLQAAAHCVEEIHIDTLEKGRSLGAALKASVTSAAKAVVLYYDALSGVDAGLLLQGMSEEIKCPILGGAASHAFFYGLLKETYVYFGNRAMNKSAAAFVLAGDFSTETSICHGCSPIGIEMEVTESDGNRVVSLDGKPAATVWEELCGPVIPEESQNLMTMLSLGVPAPSKDGNVEYYMRAAYYLDPKKGAGIADHIPKGTKVMLHHRTVHDVLNGTKKMGLEMKERLQGRNVRAVLSFECGARAKPFLGLDGTNEENRDLQTKMAEDAEWAGVLVWGELYPTAGRPFFHNFAYTVLVLAD